MSTDFNVVCKKCNQFRHLGQRWSAGYSLGYNTHDSVGQSKAMEFVSDHYNHGILAILLTDELPKDCVDKEDQDDKCTVRRCSECNRPFTVELLK